MNAPEVRIRTWWRATEAEERTGLLGYLSIFYGDLVLDGLTLRRNVDGHTRVTFPSRTDRHGNRHNYVRPVSGAARMAIERAILEQLNQHEEPAPAGEGAP